MEPGVERFNSPYSRRGLMMLAVWIAASALMGWGFARDARDLREQLIEASLSGGLWGLWMAALIVLPHQREVVLGPGTLVTRSWWGVLTRRQGRNEWVEPESSWLWRGRSGDWQVQPGGPCLNGRQPRSLAIAFERLGFEVMDERTEWLRAHPGRHRAALVLYGCGLVSCIAGLATEDMGLWLGLMGAVVVLVIAASVLDSGRDW